MHLKISIAVNRISFNCKLLGAIVCIAYLFLFFIFSFHAFLESLKYKFVVVFSRFSQKEKTQIWIFPFSRLKCHPTHFADIADFRDAVQLKYDKSNYLKDIHPVLYSSTRTKLPLTRETPPPMMERKSRSKKTLF